MSKNLFLPPGFYLFTLQGKEFFSKPDWVQTETGLNFVSISGKNDHEVQLAPPQKKSVKFTAVNGMIFVLISSLIIFRIN